MEIVLMLIAEVTLYWKVFEVSLQFIRYLSPSLLAVSTLHNIAHIKLKANKVRVRMVPSLIYRSLFSVRRLIRHLCNVVINTSASFCII